jgi:hypothetical protein
MSDEIVGTLELTQQWVEVLREIEPLVARYATPYQLNALQEMLSSVSCPEVDNHWMHSEGGVPEDA